MRIVKSILRWIFSWRGLVLGIAIIIALLSSTRFFEPGMAPDDPSVLFNQYGRWTDIHFKTDEGVIHAVKAGNPEAETLLAFVHGSPGSWYDFTSFADSFELAKDHRLLFFDRPGYGESTHPHTGSLSDQSNWIFEVIKEELENIPAENLIVFGHSYGGPVAMQIGVDHAEEVDGLVLAAPTIAMPYQEPRWYNNAADFFLIRIWLGKWLKNSNDEMIKLYESELPSLEPDFRNFENPIVFIQGGKDMLVPAPSADYFQTKCPSCDVNFILDEEMNHFVPWSHPKYLIQALRQIETEMNEEAASDSTDISLPEPQEE